MLESNYQLQGDPMSRSYKREPHYDFQYHPWQLWRASQVEDHDGYRRRPRHGKGNLVSAYDDVYKGVMRDKWVWSEERVRKIRGRGKG